MDLLSAGADVRRYTWDDANHAALALCSSMVSHPSALLEPSRRALFAEAIEKQTPQIAFGLAVSAYGEDERGYGGVYTHLLDDGIAEMVLEGPCYTSVPEWLTYYYAVIGYNLVEADVEMIRRSPQVRATHLRMSSYGGQAAGIDGPVTALTELAKVMPLTAHAAPAYSGGYWLISPAEHITVDQLQGVGSIGAVQVLYDQSKWLEKLGVTPYGLTGPNAALKLDGHPDFPISEEMLARFRADLAKVSNLFQSEAARLRGIPIEKIAALNGGTLMGIDGVTAGLADAVGSSRASLAHLQTLIKSKAPTRPNVEAPMGNKKILAVPGGASVAAEGETPAEPTVMEFQAELQAMLPEGAALDVTTCTYHIGDEWYACDWERVDGVLKMVGDAKPIKMVETEAAETETEEMVTATLQPGMLVSGGISDLTAQIEALRKQTAAEIGIAQKSIADLGAKLEAANQRAADAEAALKAADAKAERAAWDAALSVALPDSRADVEALARAAMTDGMDPAAAVAVVQAKPHMVGAFKVGVEAEKPKPRLPVEETPAGPPSVAHRTVGLSPDKGWVPEA